MSKSMWIDDIEVETRFEIAGDEYRAAKLPDGGVLVVYLAYDDEPSFVLDDDGTGKIISSSRRNGDRREYYEALGLDRDGDIPDEYFSEQEHPALERIWNRCDRLKAQVQQGDLTETLRLEKVAYDQSAEWGKKQWEKDRKAGKIGNRFAVLLDVYSHGNEHWSVAADGQYYPDEQWDVGRSAGVWVPDKSLEETLTGIAKHSYPRAMKQAAEYARQYCELYNDASSGAVFGLIVDTFDSEGTRVETDSCWGYAGWKYARQEMIDEFNRRMGEKETA